MSLVSQISSVVTAIGTEFKSAYNRMGPLGSLTTTNKSSLVNAINEVKSIADTASSSGGAKKLDDLTDVIISTLSSGHILRYNGTDFVNVLGTDFYDAAGAATAAATASQPRDTDLSAIADLTTTVFGRNLLTLNDSAGLAGQVRLSTSAVTGVVQLATSTEAVTGTDTAKATTSAGVKAHFDSRIATSTALGTSDVLVPSQNAVKAYADSLIAANDAMVFRGMIDASTNPNYPAANRGDTYRISVAGKIGGSSGVNVEIGDLIICTADNTVSGTQASVGGSWNVTQTNIDGAVTGPTSSVSGNIASFNGTGGKIVADSGFAPSNAALSGSATLLPTQAQVQAWAQQKDATLTAIAGLTTAANQVILATGVDTFSMFTTGATGRALLADATAGDARNEINVYSKDEIGNPETDFVAVLNTALNS